MILERLQLLNDSQTQDLRNFIDAIPDGWWIPENYAYPDLYEDPNCVVDYSTCIYRRMSHVYKKRLLSLAPKFDGEYVWQVAINRLRPGQCIESHRDYMPPGYTRNVVLALQTANSGIVYNGVLNPDRAGVAVVFENSQVWHSVSRVSELRYSVVYTYSTDPEQCVLNPAHIRRC